VWEYRYRPLHVLCLLSIYQSSLRWIKNPRSSNT
jgi:hypothetical protein